jgi:ABC-2 type transport system ATP-binding protein
MKVSEQAIYMARLRGMSKADATQSLLHWFRKFGIETWWDRRVEDLSKGMQQKVQFIVTVVHNPDFLIFDEPFSGFDPINAEQLKTEILELKDRGATIILSTHNMASVEEICDDIALINKGKVILEGAVNEVRRTFRQNRFHISFEGEPSINELPTWMQLIDHSTDNRTTTLQLQLADGHTANELLQYFITQNSILNFGETLPSMNDIFIRTIQAQNEKQ